MSSKRGRKRNDDLPPNRARDVQRAFRARRAAHLSALELRVAELEGENNFLRQHLNLPPSSRPPLGRGPTGKDKPTLLSSGSESLGSLPITREPSVFSDSPPSRGSSDSPVIIPISMSPSRPMTVWDETLMVERESRTAPDSTSTSASMYHISPISIPQPIVKQEYNPYTSPVPSFHGQQTEGDFLIDSVNHPQNPERPLSFPGSYEVTNYTAQIVPEDPPRTHYTYLSPSSYQSHRNDDAHTEQSPSPGSGYSPHLHPQNISHPQPQRQAHIPSANNHHSVPSPQPQSHPHSRVIQLQPRPYRPQSGHIQPQSQAPHDRRDSPLLYNVPRSHPQPNHFTLGQNYHVGSDIDPRGYNLRLQGVGLSRQGSYTTNDGQVHRSV